MTKRKSTSVESLKASQPLPMADRILPESERRQLIPPYNPMLASREPGQCHLHIASLRNPVHIAGFRRLAEDARGHGATLHGGGARVVRGSCLFC